MSNNCLIVEGNSDKFFMERLKEEINADFDISEPICNISECQCLDGITNLENKLKVIKRQIPQKGFEKIGILIDADNEGISNRVKLVHDAVKTITNDVEILKPNEWYKSEFLDVEISCHILNINDKGYLEVILKEIALKEAISANCLNSWQKCLEQHKRELNQADFDKLWLNVYLHYDCFSKKEMGNAKNCNFKNSLNREFWDFSHPTLNDLKNYLSSFNSLKPN
ncbi:MAG: hypothetical protein GQ569_03295 [Methylococcaceae bacterium]|nr:hypothetical protein [Methylococcaceae bacterium]